MTNTSGVVKDQRAYDPYGRVAQLQGTITADIQYAGYYVHAASGLNLTRTRAYGSSLGRFTSRDTAAEKAGSNLFAYVLNNPINAIDPSGTDLYVTYGQKRGYGGNLHHQICVDTWTGCCTAKEGRFCISYGNIAGGRPFGTGAWYEDPANDSNPILQPYLKETTCTQDKDLLGKLRGMLNGETGPYTFLQRTILTGCR